MSDSDCSNCEKINICDYFDRSYDCIFIKAKELQENFYKHIDINNFNLLSEDFKKFSSFVYVEEIENIIRIMNDIKTMLNIKIK